MDERWSPSSACDWFFHEPYLKLADARPFCLTNRNSDLDNRDFRDIGDLKKEIFERGLAENALTKSEGRLALVFQGSNEGLVDL
jgi:hypothetical protein